MDSNHRSSIFGAPIIALRTGRFYILQPHAVQLNRVHLCFLACGVGRLLGIFKVRGQRICILLAIVNVPRLLCVR